MVSSGSAPCNSREAGAGNRAFHEHDLANKRLKLPGFVERAVQQRQQRWLNYG